MRVCKCILADSFFARGFYGTDNLIVLVITREIML